VDLDLCLLGFIWKSHMNKFCSFFLWITFEGVHLRESPPCQSDSKGGTITLARFDSKPSSTCLLHFKSLMFIV
jgi:hypothetical protein